MDIVFLIYGLAFVSLGVAIVLRYQSGSDLELAQLLWLLAVFGFLHGFVELMDFWRISRGALPWPNEMRMALLIASFLPLFEFGRRLSNVLVMADDAAILVRWLLSPWIYAAIGLGILGGAMLSDELLLGADIWARYLLGFPGALMSGVALLVYDKVRLPQHVQLSDYPELRYISDMVSASFIFYGALGGLIVPSANWFPASFINEDAFLAHFGFPVQLARATCAVVITVSFTMLLKVFQLEGLRKLEHRVHERTLELQASEAQARELALVASGTDNAVIIMDPKAHITWVNAGFTKMCGFSLEEARGRRPGELLNGPQTEQATLDYIQEKVAQGERFETEIVHYHKDGSPYWAVVDLQAVRDEAGAVVKYISIERDITRRKENEVALRNSETRLKEAQELAHIGSWELDLATDEYVLSDEARRIHEISAPTGRISRVALMSVLYPDDAVRLRQIQMEAMNNLGAYAMTARLLFADGRIKHVQARGSVQSDDGRHPSRVVGTVQDITEQKLTELELRRLNETLEQRVLQRTEELDRQRAFIETILETAETLIFVVDSAGRFVRFNRACERLTGYSFEELRGQPIWELVITPERRREVRLKHENQKDPSKLQTQLEVEWLTKEGQRRLLSWSNAVITDGRGEMMYMIGTGIDITDRKRAEQDLLVANKNLGQSIKHLRQTQSQLVQAEKMASLGGLVAGISHEINTPLGIGVTSATSLQEELQALQRSFQTGGLKRSALERFIAHGLEGADILVRNLIRAADLIRGFKQVAVDQSSGEQREIDLSRYVDEVVLSLQPRFKGGRIRVINACEPDLRIRTHPGAIYQILSNLLINALVHAYEPEQSGSVHIEARRENDQVVLGFSDDGKGIAREHQGRIFDPFFTTRRGAGGSGLGLHIVFNVVVSTLKGSIRLVENAEKGTRFLIVFPLTPQQRDEQV